MAKELYSIIASDEISNDIIRCFSSFGEVIVNKREQIYVYPFDSPEAWMWIAQEKDMEDLLNDTEQSELEKIQQISDHPYFYLCQEKRGVLTARYFFNNFNSEAKFLFVNCFNKVFYLEEIRSLILQDIDWLFLE